MRILHDSYGEIFYVIEEKDWPMFAHTTKRRELFTFFIWEKGNVEVCRELKRKDWKNPEFNGLQPQVYSIDVDGSNRQLLKDGAPVDLQEFVENTAVKNVYDQALASIELMKNADLNTVAQIRVALKGNASNIGLIEIVEKLLKHYYKTVIED